MACSRIPCGIWKSPYRKSDISRSCPKLTDLHIDSYGLYWIASRPAEEGGEVILKYSERTGVQPCVPLPFSVRSRVNEYGGGAFAVADGEIFFVNDSDQCLYHANAITRPFAITEPSAHRFGNLIVDGMRNRIICVQEHHALGAITQRLVAVNYDHLPEVRGLAQGQDFYASPCISPDGTQIAWISWNHPAMPWDTTELWLADIKADGSLENPIRVAGGMQESLQQPQWLDNKTLLFMSDRTNWWNIYAFRQGGIQPFLSRNADYAGPPWVLGMSSYGIAADGSVICTWFSRGKWHLGRVSSRGRFYRISTPFVEIAYISVKADRAAFIAATVDRPTAVYSWKIGSAACNLVAEAAAKQVRSHHVSPGQALRLPITRTQTAEVFFYAPSNPRYQIRKGESPPLLLNVHGGPSSSVTRGFNAHTQYWTTRGFAVAEINYRGSTGYGRQYRDALKSRWGAAEVEDCRRAARYLCARGLADSKRIVIRGRSAGGFTVLNALRQSEVFAAGVVYYGVTDLRRLLLQTHRFESHYLDWLIGPYPMAKQVYAARSPLLHVHEINRPLLFFQGSKDPVVPATQTEAIVSALKKRGITAEFVLFPDESHGFRQATTVATCIQKEEDFYRRIFDLAAPSSTHGKTRSHQTARNR